MKIYTKTGDQGETSLYGGKRVLKNNIQIEAYGTVDELNSYVGLLRSFPCLHQQRDTLIQIQDRLFTLGSALAADAENTKLNYPSLSQKDIVLLETEIDTMDNSLVPMTAFILPGGNQEISFCHIARTICRRAERNVITLNQIQKVDTLIIQYLNRLSDYLFTLSRWIGANEKADEIKWVPKY